MENFIRQGDMFIVKLNRTDVQNKISVEKKSLTVGVGEVSGHSHLIRPIGNATLLEFGNENETLTNEDIFVDREETFFEVKGGNAVILHEEHGPIVLEEGVYKRYNQVAYNPFEKKLERVRD